MENGKIRAREIDLRDVRGIQFCDRMKRIGSGVFGVFDKVVPSGVSLKSGRIADHPKCKLCTSQSNIHTSIIFQKPNAGTSDSRKYDNVHFASLEGIDSIDLNARVIRRKIDVEKLAKIGADGLRLSFIGRNNSNGIKSRFGSNNFEKLFIQEFDQQNLGRIVKGSSLRNVDRVGNVVKEKRSVERVFVESVLVFVHTDIGSVYQRSVVECRRRKCSNVRMHAILNG